MNIAEELEAGYGSFYESYGRPPEKFLLGKNKIKSLGMWLRNEACLIDRSIELLDLFHGRAASKKITFMGVELEKSMVDDELTLI